MAAAAAELLVVDTRPTVHYLQAHVPGSINLPAYLLPVRTWPEGRRLLLIDAAGADARLGATCERLRARGHAVAVLSGGLQAWAAAGGAVRGTAPLAARFQRVSPRAFVAQQTAYHWTIVATRAELPLARRLFPGHRVEAASSLLAVTDAGAASGRRWLIVSRGIDDLPGSPSGVVTLAGGLPAYQAYTRFRDDLRARTTGALRERRSCAG